MKTSLRDVARRAGVSLATASYVLNNGPRPVSAELRHRVLTAVRELSYEPPVRDRRRMRPLSIALVVPDAAHPFFAGTIQGIDDVVSRDGHLLFVASSREDPIRERQLINSLLHRRINGVILTPCREVTSFVEHLSQRGVAVVIMDREGGSPTLNRVTINNYASAFQGVRLLWESGHTRIALVNGPDEIDTYRERLRGYTDALIFAGLAQDAELVRRGPQTLEHGLQATRTLLGLAEPPSAIFSSSAVLTAGVLSGLRERRLRVPDDIALVGFGDPVWASLVTPPLTVIEQPTVRLGEAAARLLLAMLGNELSATGQRVVLETRLVLRESHWRVARPVMAGAPAIAASEES
jgi:DNA-binding LacI/PurR family transcriptional regulator